MPRPPKLVDPLDPLQRCHAVALRILNHRWNSVAELRNKLRRKGFDDETVVATLGRLQDANLLDDQRFAEGLVRDRVRKRIGSRRISQELGAAGVDRETAGQVMTEHADPERERAALLVLCQRRKSALIRRHGEEFLATPEGRKKLAAYLLNQGYDFALVAEVIGSDELHEE